MVVVFVNNSHTYKWVPSKTMGFTRESKKREEIMCYIYGVSQHSNVAEAYYDQLFEKERDMLQ